MSGEFQRKGKAYGETNRLSSSCYILLGIWGDTSDGNRGTKQNLPPHNAHLPHLQTFGWLSYTHQTETGNYEWWQGGLLVEARGNGKVAIRCCCSNRCNIDEQSLHQEKLGCTSVSKTSLG